MHVNRITLRIFDIGSKIRERINPIFMFPPIKLRLPLLLSIRKPIPSHTKLPLSISILKNGRTNWRKLQQLLEMLQFLLIDMSLEVFDIERRRRWDFAEICHVCWLDLVYDDVVGVGK